MRWLILNTDYPEFLLSLYAAHSDLGRASFDEQMQRRNESLFGVADAYSEALNELGDEAADVHVNNVPMQQAWARENSRAAREQRVLRPQLRLRRGLVPWLSRTADRFLTSTLRAQVEAYRPDTVFVHDMAWMEPSLLRALVGPTCLLVGQHAATALPAWDLHAYDLVVSSWPPTIERFRGDGIRCERVDLAFDPRVLTKLGPGAKRSIPVSFVGSLGSLHASRLDLLEAVAEADLGLEVWGPTPPATPAGSSLRACYRGPAFGRDMYDVLARSQITLNHHGVPEPHANNMRLFEATGVGTPLLTDDRSDLGRLFRPGVDVLVYASAEECIATLREADESELRDIAARGQQRTLAEHRWSQRLSQIRLHVLDL